MKLCILTPILMNGYIEWVCPWRIPQGDQFYMLGDYGGYCPINIEKRS